MKTSQNSSLPLLHSHFAPTPRGVPLTDAIAVLPQPIPHGLPSGCSTVPYPGAHPPGRAPPHLLLHGGLPQDCGRRSACPGALPGRNQHRLGLSSGHQQAPSRPGSDLTWGSCWSPPEATALAAIKSLSCRPNIQRHSPILKQWFCCLAVDTAAAVQHCQKESNAD